LRLLAVARLGADRSDPWRMSDFDPQTLRPMIIEMYGDVRAIAKKVHADSEDLRNFIMNTPLLRRALDEVVARAVDQSLTVLQRGLDDDDHYGNQLGAAKVLLKTRAGQRRGFHSAADLELRMPGKGGALTLTWLPPEAPSAGSGRRPEPPMIEGKVEE
jgi:hypothetical protein